MDRRVPAFWLGELVPVANELAMSLDIRQLSYEDSYNIIFNDHVPCIIPNFCQKPP